MGQIKVFHVEDYKIMRDGIKQLLSRDPEIKQVGEANSGEQLFSRIRSIEVDVVILDTYLDMMDDPKKLNGFEICRMIKEQYPNIKILVHSAYNDADRVSRAIKAGALGFVSKNSGFEELIHAVKMVYLNKVYICHETANGLKNLNSFLEGTDATLQQKGELFSARERQILDLLAQGKSSKDIASLLLITERTVETHRKNMINKARVKNTVELIAYSASIGLLRK